MTPCSRPCNSNLWSPCPSCTSYQMKETVSRHAICHRQHSRCQQHSANDRSSFTAQCLVSLRAPWQPRILEGPNRFSWRAMLWRVSTARSTSWEPGSTSEGSTSASRYMQGTQCQAEKLAGKGRERKTVGFSTNFLLNLSYFPQQGYLEH